jgi:HAD superfamily hydrolase (TIGR01549 family)
MIKDFIFDIDGTLIDSVDFHAEAWQAAFEKYGKEIPFETVRKQIGKGADKLLPEFLSEDEIKSIGEELTELRGNIFKNEYLSRIKPFPKVRELFERIVADGKRIALASSAKKEELQEFKEIAKIGDLIREETSADDAEESKPAPDIFEAALELLGNPALENVLVIGDTPYDAEAALKARLKVVGVLCGGFPEKDLRIAGCLDIYRNPADLLENFDKLVNI